MVGITKSNIISDNSTKSIGMSYLFELFESCNNLLGFASFAFFWNNINLSNKHSFSQLHRYDFFSTKIYSIIFPESESKSKPKPNPRYSRATLFHFILTTPLSSNIRIYL